MMLSLTGTGALLEFPTKVGAALAVEEGAWVLIGLGLTDTLPPDDRMPVPPSPTDWTLVASLSPLFRSAAEVVVLLLAGGVIVVCELVAWRACSSDLVGKTGGADGGDGMAIGCVTSQMA
jgi:hypothetical protein